MNAKEVRLLVIDALKNKTDAGDRIYSPRDWPTTSEQYPAILVQTPIDVKNSLGRNVPQFTTVTTVRITGRLQEFDDEQEDNGAEKAEEALEQLREQVERAVINGYELTRKIQQFRQVRSTIDVDAGGEGHTAQLLMELDIEYYQGPEEFFEIESEPLEGFDARISMPDGTPEPLVKINLE
ncbi:ATP-binding protein [Erwinia sp. S38]|uniref:ATP-binding protein n=1 Tax=Erwinia sp. S38 TaxID=2769338 RepID=UPI00190C2D96|nr:ATP-binding protein [Erwinia sp. S38]MBK0004377.1 ATP-binding protein [Erwinia sp. S38]